MCVHACVGVYEALIGESHLLGVGLDYYRSILQICPPFCMLALGKTGEGLMRGIVTFPCDDHYR